MECVKNGLTKHTKRAEGDVADQSIFNSPWAGLGAGLSVGAGAMILFLAKWGSKIFGTDVKVSADKVNECPFSKDHPMFNQFMRDSLSDRALMRRKIDDVSDNVSEIKGKLELLLQGARVRWNSGLIPPDNKG